MNLTLELLRFIGSPFTQEARIIEYNDAKLIQLHQLSIKNRMQFQFLTALRKKGNIGQFAALYAEQKTKCLENAKVICNVSEVLTDSNVSHAIFKTLRPYESTTVDVDTLIFGKATSYVRAIRSLQNKGFKRVAVGPRSTTLLEPRTKMGVDLYEQVAVSFLIYMEKEKIADFITTAELSKGSVKILEAEADLGAIIAHSVVKEQMYTLSEYYSFLHYLKYLDISRFLDMLRRNNLVSAGAAHATITAMLHQLAHRTIPIRLKQIVDDLGKNAYETNLLLRNNMETPHKYHIITVGRSLMEIMKGKECRGSLATQFLHMANPYFSKEFLKAALKHIARNTY